MADSRSQKQEQGGPKPKLPPAGPHAKPELTNYDATPGAGVLPDDKAKGNETDSGAG